RERAVVGRDFVGEGGYAPLALPWSIRNPVVEVARQALGGAPALGEHQRGAMGLHELGNLLERGVPHRVAGGGEEVVDGRDDLHVEVAGEAGVDDDGIAAAGAGE